MRDRIREGLLLGGYWFLGGYIFTWSLLPLASYAFQAGLIGVIIGLSLLAWAHIIEDLGGHVPVFLGCALFAPPWTLIFIAFFAWGMQWLGLL